MEVILAQTPDFTERKQKGSFRLILTEVGWGGGVGEWADVHDTVIRSSLHGHIDYILTERVKTLGLHYSS